MSNGFSFQKQRLIPDKNNFNYQHRHYDVVKCSLDCYSHGYDYILNKAKELAINVNKHRANNSLKVRDYDTLLKDAFGGLIAETALYFYIRNNFGAIVDFTPFTEAKTQIDLLLDNNKKIEVRSSFVRNGINFALFNKKYNFRNICKYNNLYKLSEMDKDFFFCVLFDTPKKDLMYTDKINFYLVGGSTKWMMEDPNLSYVQNLVAEDDIAQELTNYCVVDLIDTLDISSFDEYIRQTVLLNDNINNNYDNSIVVPNNGKQQQLYR